MESFEAVLDAVGRKPCCSPSLRQATSSSHPLRASLTDRRCLNSSFVLIELKISTIL